MQWKRFKITVPTHYISFKYINHIFLCPAGDKLLESINLMWIFPVSTGRANRSNEWINGWIHKPYTLVIHMPEQPPRDGCTPGCAQARPPKCRRHHLPCTPPAGAAEPGHRRRRSEPLFRRLGQSVPGAKSSKSVVTKTLSHQTSLTKIRADQAEYTPAFLKHPRPRKRVDTFSPLLGGRQQAPHHSWSAAYYEAADLNSPLPPISNADLSFVGAYGGELN